MNSGDIFVWFDADSDNFNFAKSRIEDTAKENGKEIDLYFIRSNFKDIEAELKKLSLTPTCIYYDFWLNSVHVDDASKWFSFKKDWPLDLRFDRLSWITAADVVNTYSESELKRVFYSYWEEKKTPFIVREIISKRSEKRIETTLELAEIIDKSSFDPKSKTRVFQALRIEVNDEFQVIKDSLNSWIKILDKWWVMACITFHSLEDKLVKEIFLEFTKDEISQLTWQVTKKWLASKITKKPIMPSDEEITDNPRSRSAKLRAIIKN